MARRKNCKNCGKKIETDEPGHWCNMGVRKAKNRYEKSIDFLTRWLKASAVGKVFEKQLHYLVWNADSRAFSVTLGHKTFQVVVRDITPFRKDLRDD